MRRLAIPFVAVLLLSAAVSAARAETFTLVNRSTQTIVALSVRPVSSGGWGPSLLGAALAPQARLDRVELPPGAGCEVDVRVAYSDGGTLELRSIDLCRVRTLAVAPDAEEELQVEVAAAIGEGRPGAI